MRRVARKRVVVLTFDPDASWFWLTDDYFPGIVTLDRERMPRVPEVIEVLGAQDVVRVLVPHDCTDGFLGAFWRKPEAYLDPRVRAAMSCFSRIDATSGLARLADDLCTGRWHERYQDLLALESADLGYRLVIAER